MTADKSKKPDKPRARKAVDPEKRRPANWEETSPETLLPETEPASSQDQQSAPEDAERRARIEQRAHELARERGFEPGHELEDWLRAEQEIDAKRKQTPPGDQFTG